jgi:hypothetical protein
MAEPQWADGKPSYSVTITAAEALEELRDAAALARDHHYDRERRIRLSLAMAWLENKLSSETDN